MKNIARILILSLLFCIAAAATHAAVPPINVTVSGSDGKVVFKGATNATGSFATKNLKAGDYVVQFASNNTALKANSFGLLISSGTAKISVHAIGGERLLGAGIGMKITVGIPISEVVKQNPGLNNPAAIKAMEQENRDAKNITGQVTVEH